jgi:elongator complex protein 3
MQQKLYTREKPRKPVRTISGVTPLTVVLKPRKCNHGTCIYCPGGEYTPQSYTDKSPAIMRALKLRYDPFKQVQARLKALNAMGHPTDKIELIILGGTFLQYDTPYQYNFIKRCFDALNEKKAKNLGQAKKWNEKARNRCVAMCIENRPDNCSNEEIKRMLDFGCTRVEIGIQILDDEIYKKIHRGHSVKDVIEATKALKNAGFKLGYHVMPGLPYSNSKKDIEKFKIIFQDERFRPDQLKIYPCQIVRDSPLEKMYQKIGYRPYNEKQTKEIVKEMMRLIPGYCRVMRIMREIPGEKMVFDPVKLDLRKDIEEELRVSNSKIKEIRMREVGFNKYLDKRINLKITKYKASDGDEYFLELVNKEDVLFGLLRLRIFEGRAIVRELHVYGQALNLGERKDAAQHKGFGKWLMDEAEKITKENKIKKLAVISGIGVREYYRKLGYNLEGFYMVKKLL